MIFKLRYLILLALFSSFSISKAQYYDMGQDPTSINWKQIKTENFQIIFPKEFEDESQRLANILEIVYKYGSESLQHKPKKISVILHTQTVKSNASVIWTPKRMEIYTCPPQDNYAQDWLEQLAIHEFRHVVQVDKLNQGITKILYALLGEQAAAAVLGLYIPQWLLEGDAVLTETLLSQSGRGRLPGFERELRTQLIEKGAYKYDKAVYGSYKDFITNHYVLGYHLVTTARKNYGPDIWPSAFDNVARKPFMIIPFNNSIKKSTGLTKTKLYKSVMNELDSLWKDQDLNTQYTRFEPLTKQDNKSYTEYSFPHYITDSTYFAVKSSIDDISRFVEIDKNGNEKILFTPGNLQFDAVCYSNNRIVWAETRNDIRWGNRSFNDIKTYNIETGKAKTIVKKSRLFAPTYSCDESKIVAVEITTENKYSIVVLSSESGEIIKRIKSPTNDFFMTPTFADDGKHIVTVVMNSNGKTLAVVDIESEKIEYLFPETNTEISGPCMTHGFVYFVAAYSGLENVYVFNLITQEISQVVSSRFGANDICFNEDMSRIIYKDYTANGFAIVDAYINQAEWVKLDSIKNNSIKLYETLIPQEFGVISKDIIPKNEYEVKNYNRLLHLFNIHSWAPLSIDAVAGNAKPGVSFMSQNKLSTAFTTIGWEWDVNEQQGTYFADFSYKGLFPEIDFRYEYGNRKGIHKTQNDSLIKYSWKETRYRTSFTLPLRFTRSKWQRGFLPRASWNLLELEMDKSSGLEFNYNKLDAVDGRLYFYNLLKRSSKDLIPKWGQIIDINHRITPFDKTDDSEVKSAEAWLYFPALINHHGIEFYLGYQNKKFDRYSFSDFVSYPRGYIDQFSDELSSFKANYKFPFLYPDWSLGSLVYLKRLKANIFYDYAEGSLHGVNTIYRSTGFELIGDMHLLRFIAPIEMGVRGIYLPNKNTTQFELIFSVGFDEI
ncbi:MAG: hypothetical protein K9J13_09205 [Saprospiraceae bacterium]|nr:hypothetical protein [Saprospiraceae bacterium]